MMRISRGSLLKHLNVGITAALLCACLGVLIQNYLLIRENHEIRAASQTHEIVPGKHINGLAAVNMKGELERVQLPTRENEKLLIIAFSPLCNFCRRNTPGWRHLTEQLRQNPSWRIVWVSRNSGKVTHSYCQEQHLPESDVLSDPLHGTYLDLGLDTVPTLLAVEAGGVIRRVWRGALDTQGWKEVAEYTNLPYDSIVRQGENSN